MAFRLLALLLHFLLYTNSVAHDGTILTIVNNCPFRICPGIQSNSGYPVPGSGGFCLETLQISSFPVPGGPWSGRVWARTGCSSGPQKNSLCCETGGCSNQLACNGAGGEPPISLAEFSFPADPNGAAVYSVSLVDGFNLPLTVTPHWGKGECPVVGCRNDLMGGCPSSMVVRGGDGQVVGCKSACLAFGTDEFCCKGEFAEEGKCRPSDYSKAFKTCCPEANTYPKDNASARIRCYSPEELKVIFCH